jgi:hypothetical protein
MMQFKHLAHAGQSSPLLTSRTVVYAKRTYGGVGGGGREVTPYPYMGIFAQTLEKPGRKIRI